MIIVFLDDTYCDTGPDSDTGYAKFPSNKSTSHLFSDTVRLLGCCWGEEYSQNSSLRISDISVNICQACLHGISNTSIKYHEGYPHLIF